MQFQLILDRLHHENIKVKRIFFFFGYTGISVTRLLVDRRHYFLLRDAIFTRGHSEDLGCLWVIRTVVRRQDPKPHDNKAELPACQTKK